MSSPGWIAYVGPFHFPWGQPGSRRVYGIARSLAALDYQVIVGCGTAEPLKPTLLEECEGRGSISFVGLGELPPPHASLPNKLIQLLWQQGSRTVDWLDGQSNRPSYVILYGGHAPFMYRLLPWCLANNIPLLIDVVEWYSPKQMAGGFFGPFHLSAKYALSCQYRRANGIIAISTLLRDYYSSRGLPVVCIPPTVDVRQMPPLDRSASSPTFTIVYAGTPGKKDLLVEVIRGVQLVDHKGKCIRLVLVGVTSVQVAKLLGGSPVPDFVEPLGRLPQEEVTRIVASADFSVLLRPYEHFTQAGFPTKFVESFAVGTPVIGNHTSDLARHLIDGQTGLVCHNHSAQTFAEVLQRALELTPDQLMAMRKAVRTHAEEHFDYRNFTVPIKNFLEEVIS